METITELTSVIQQEAEIAELLEALLKEKQNAFIYWKPEELDSVVKQEESFIRRIAELEKIRISLVTHLSQNGEQKKLSIIADEFGSEDLRTQSKRLRAASESVIKKNDQNKQLLQSSLSFVQHTLVLLTNNYQRQLIDQKA
jgi:flagellar biosynthesis/type III secretory pathway chaperone